MTYIISAINIISPTRLSLELNKTKAAVCHVAKKSKPTQHKVKTAETFSEDVK